MAWLMILDRNEQTAWAAGVADRLEGRTCRADRLPEELRAAYLAGWQG